MHEQTKFNKETEINNNKNRYLRAEKYDNWTVELNRVSTTDSTMQNKESIINKTVHLALSIQSAKEKRMKKSDESLWDLWRTIRRNNIYNMENQKERVKAKDKIK